MILSCQNHATMQRLRLGVQTKEWSCLDSESQRFPSTGTKVPTTPVLAYWVFPFLNALVFLCTSGSSVNLAQITSSESSFWSPQRLRVVFLKPALPLVFCLGPDQQSPFTDSTSHLSQGCVGSQNQQSLSLPSCHFTLLFLYL